MTLIGRSFRDQNISVLTWVYRWLFGPMVRTGLLAGDIAKPGKQQIRQGSALGLEAMLLAKQVRGRLVHHQHPSPPWPRNPPSH